MNYYSFDGLQYLYIHWPFCLYKCHFCDFVALASHDEYMERYHYALKKEIIDFAEDQQQKYSLKTIYMGGGTPSTYPLPLLLDTFATLKSRFTFEPDIEITLEVNPGAITKEAVQAWKGMGINRLSVGVQSLQDGALHTLNRLQKKADVIELFSIVPDYISNVSVDFILGLPYVSSSQWKEMIVEAMQWPITHISIYFLMVHEKTPLYFKVHTSAVLLPPDEEIIDLYWWTVQTLQDHGFNRYEVSNFAKNGYESRHNKAYWDRKKYKAFGLGACSFDGQYRFQNEKQLMKYMQNIEQNVSVLYEEEQLTIKQVQTERIMLGLRLTTGMMVSEVLQDFTEQEKENFYAAVAILENQGLLEHKNGKIALTPHGFLVENEVAVRLFP